MTQTLDELKTKLYSAFDRALDAAVFPTRPYINSEGDQAKAAAQALTSAAELARAITGVEHELNERSERKNGIPLPGKN